MPSEREYIVLRMNRNGNSAEFAYIGEVYATTHHVAKNEAIRQYDLDQKVGINQGIVVVPSRSWHSYSM